MGQIKDRYMDTWTLDMKLNYHYGAARSSDGNKNKKNERHISS